MTGVAQNTENYEAGKIKLLWTAPSTFNTVGSKIQYYQILKDVGSGVFYEHADVDGDLLAYTDIDLVPGNRYTYKVRAYNEMGFGAESALLTGTAG